MGDYTSNGNKRNQRNNSNRNINSSNNSNDNRNINSSVKHNAKSQQKKVRLNDRNEKAKMPFEGSLPFCFKKY